MARFTGLLGLLVFLGIAYALSTNRRAIRWRTVAWGLGLQVVFAFLVIDWTFGQKILKVGSDAVTSMLGHAADGSSMVFGPVLGDPKNPLATFAFAVLPTIIFVSAFFAVLYHIGVMQQIIKVVAWVMQRTMGTSGAESTNVAASIFMGQTEAPLTIRPFLGGATRSELMTIMTSGMAHVSGGIMAAYILFGIHAQDLLSAVIMTAPGTILIAKMLLPETEVPATMGTVTMPPDEEHANENLIGAIARGTIDGGKLALNIAIMLISFLALVGLVNACMLGISNFLWAHGHVPFPHSLGNALGTLASPVAWLIGIPWKDAARRSATSLARAPCLMSSSPSTSSASSQKPAQSPRAPSPSPPSLCAGLRTSAPLACRSAASVRSFPTAATNSPRSACAPCLPGPWPTSCPLAS